MNLLAIGLSHNSAPVRVLERAAVGSDDLAKLLDELLRSEHISETFVLATCNRVEVYAIAETFHGGLDDVTSVLARHAGCEVSELADYLYVYYAGAAVEHLFSVAAGLDSMVVGEAQILGQLRQSYAAADDAGTIGKALHELAQQGLRVGKRVHAETDIDAAGASVVSEVLADAEGVLGGLAGQSALLIGAGSMGALAASQLKRLGVAEIVVANRTAANGERLVESLRDEGVAARTAALSDLVPCLIEADVVVTCTGAVGAVVSAETVSQASASRSGHRPLLFCDLGLPRDTAPEVAELPDVTVVDLESLQRRLSGQRGGGDVERARAIVAEEVRGYLAAQRSAEVTPTVTALRQRAAEVVNSELLRLDSRLPDLEDGVRDELARTVRRVVDKLLHTPTVRVKQLASVPGGTEYADALRELFELDAQTAAVISTPQGTDDLGDSGAGVPVTRVPGAGVSQPKGAQGTAVGCDQRTQDGEER